MINKTMKKFFIISLLTLLLLGVASASETNKTTDTKDTDNTITHDTSNVMSKDSVTTITLNKTIKKQKLDNRTTKTATKTVNVKNYKTLQSTLSSKEYNTITLNIKANINLAGNVKINKAIKNITINGNGKTISGQNKYQFLKIEENRSVTLKNLKIINCRADNGAAIYNKGNLSITHTTLKNNKAEEYGGAINNEGKITITHSSLINNNAFIGGAINNDLGTIIIKKSKLKYNKVYDYGGAVKNYNGTLIITDSLINNNYNTAIQNSKTLIIINTTLNNNNNAEVMGGAISNDDTVTITNCTLNNNKAKSGGAICNFGNITITNTTLSNNTATEVIYREGGGAIWNYGNLNVSYCSLNNNNARVSGGAIGNGLNLTISNCELNNNQAEDKGGAIISTGTEGEVNLIIINSTLNYNKAQFGGAIFNYHNLKITNSTINKNTAVQDGAIGNSWGTLTITGSTLNKNDIALYNSGGTLNVKNSTLNYNRKGAIQNYENLKITNCNINNNNEEAILNGGTLKITNCNIINNTGKQCGAIDSYGNLSITKCNLINNKGKLGGAIHISSFDINLITVKNIKTNHIDNNTFYKNHARKGSAIFINETTQYWKNGKFVYNTNKTITYITNNNFIQNKAKTGGSAIINKGNNTHMTNNTNMKKSRDSSTIHILQGTNTLIQSNIFHITKTATKITVTPIKQKTYKQNITITGKLTDKTGNIIKNTLIKVKLNTKTYTTKTNSKGVYTVRATADKVGTNNVTVTYPGSAKYNAVSKKTTFKTIPRATKLTVNNITTSVRGKTVKITGKLTDNLKSPIINSLLKIKINTKTFTVKTNSKGDYIYTYKATTKGTNNVAVTFAGSINYKASNAKTAFKVK